MAGLYHRGSGEPLVLIHGFSGTWRVWEPVLPALAERHEVFAPTLAGHLGGEPLAHGVEATVSALADVIERQLDAAGLDTPHVAGNSLGGWLTLELARRGRARSAVCIAPAGGWLHGSRSERRARRLFTRNYLLAAAVEPQLEGLLARPGLRRLILREVMVHGDRATRDQALGMLRGMLACPIYWELMRTVIRDGPPDWLPEVAGPVLIAWPERDRIIPERRYSEPFRRIPGVEWRALPGVGHTPMWDDPELTAATILDFTARHAGSVSGAAATAAGP